VKNPLDRRTLLKGAFGAALALPMLEAMRPSRAFGQTVPTAPRRILFVFKANGDQVTQRFTTRSETGFQLGEFLAPLEPYRSDLLFLEGIDKRFDKLPSTELADNHEQGGSGLAPWASGSGSFPVGGTNRTVGYVLGPSADIALGQRVQKAFPGVLHRSLVYRVGDRYNNIWNTHAHGGPSGTQNPIAPETDPWAAYARLFNPVFNDTTNAAVRRQLALKRSALDLILPEAGALRTRLGAEDRSRLDRHTDALRDIERVLQSPGSTAASCKALTLGTKIDPYADDNHVLIGDLFFRITALAFACDLTRVGQFNWSGNTNDRIYKTLGMTEGHHTISHNSDATSFANIRKIKKHLWTQSTRLYEILKATPDDTGTLWDHTLVVHWDELDQGDTHDDDNNLVVLAGKAHGALRTGRYLNFAGKTVNGFADMLVSCFRYMGFSDVNSFGDPRFNSNAPLPGLT
jgi:hypothetical protein